MTNQLPRTALVLRAEQLVDAVGCSAPVAARFVEPINVTLERFDIITPRRAAAWLAQVSHESGRLTRLNENLNYSATGLALTWPNRYRGPDGAPNALALSLHRNPEAIANNCYSGRMGNGDEASGDGWRYRGRGLIQTTGRDNYAAVSRGLGVNALTHPEILESELYAALSAGWYWRRHDLNELADIEDLRTMTRRINGGLIGYDDREQKYARAIRVLA